MKDAVLIIACLFYISVQVGGNMDGGLEGYVVAGSFPSITQYPHSVFLSGYCPDAAWICGATVLNQRILLTAGHCWVNDCMPSSFTVEARMGDEDLRTAKIIRNIADARVHNDYDERRLDNDIALLLMERNVPLGANVKRVIISPMFPDTGHEGFVTGWGRTENNKSSKLLKHVYQKLRSVKTCRQVGTLHQGMFCASDPGDAYPDAGDSGGALITGTGYIQIGIVSFKVLKLPHLLTYTNVTYYYTWITNNAKRLYCKF